MGFSNTIQMFSKENEKKVVFFLLFDRNRGNGMGFTLYLYMCARREIIDGYCFDGERDFLFGIQVWGDLWYQRELGDDTL